MKKNDTTKSESFLERRKRYKKLTDKVRNEYARLHTVCPKCGGKNYYTTYVGHCITIDENSTFESLLNEYRDDNNVKCECGWKGIRHDMVPEE